MDVGEVGMKAAELMDRLVDDYEGLEPALGVVAVVVEINYTEDGEDYTDIRYLCSDTRKWIQAGLLDHARRAVYEGTSDGEDE